MQNVVAKQASGLVTGKGFSAINIAGISVATLMGAFVTYSLLKTNTLQSKLMRLQIIKLNRDGIMEQQSKLSQAFDKIDEIAGIYKAPVAADTKTTSADGGVAAVMVEGDPSQYIKEYSAPQIGGGFSAAW